MAHSHALPLEPTPEEERRLEADSLRAELAWILGSECPAVFARLASLLQGCLAQLQDASATSNRNEPLRGESHDGALRFALTVGSRDLQALQVQFVLPKWNRGLPYKAALAGGRRFSLVLPQLLTLHNKLGQAVAALSDGHATLPAAQAVLERLLVLLPDALRAVLGPLPPGPPGQGWPAQPSARARLLTEQMAPEPPEAERSLLLDATLCASPARLLLSAYLLHRTGAGGGVGGAAGPGGAGGLGGGGAAGAADDSPAVAEARHATAALPGLDGTLQQLEQATEMWRELVDKGGRDGTTTPLHRGTLHEPAGSLQGPRPLLRCPERRLSSSETRQGLVAAASATLRLSWRPGMRRSTFKQQVPRPPGQAG